MLKGQGLLLGGAIVMFVVLSMMPTGVVDNDKEQVAESPEMEKMQDDHSKLPDEVLKEIGLQREAFYKATDRTAKATALQGLVKPFVSNNKFDSAAKYADLYAIDYPSFESFLKAGDLYYEAFTYAISKEKAGQMAQKAQQHYNKVLEERPDTLDIKVKVGMTLIQPDNPMKGILMIREVLESDPKNRTALMHLGVLSISSGQLKKAEDRFSKMLEYYPDDEEALYYLGTVYAEQGRQEETLKLFNRLEEISENGIILQAVKKYKESIKHDEADHEGEH